MLYINISFAPEGRMSASPHDHPQPMPPSALSVPATVRFAAVAGLIAVLWVAVGWGLSWW
jgi:hypothetical protein